MYTFTNLAVFSGINTLEGLVQYDIFILCMIYYIHTLYDIFIQLLHIYVQYITNHNSLCKMPE